jgi:hypothetical protein
VTPSSAYWPKRLGAAAVPAPDGATWPKCKHPKTPANTQDVGGGRLRCRMCRRALNRDYVNRRKAMNE